MNHILATLKGYFGTSLDIILQTAHQVGDVLDLSTIVHMVPDGVRYGDFFRSYVDFCTGNNSSKYYRVETVRETSHGYELQVSPIVVTPLQ